MMLKNRGSFQLFVVGFWWTWSHHKNKINTSIRGDDGDGLDGRGGMTAVYPISHHHYLVVLMSIYLSTYICVSGTGS